MFDACIYVDHGCGSPTVWESTIRRARKHYKCEECCESIDPGDRYHYYRALWDGIWFTHRTCFECHMIHQSLFRGDGPEAGAMWEYIHDQYCGFDEDTDEPECICPTRN